MSKTKHTWREDKRLARERAMKNARSAALAVQAPTVFQRIQGTSHAFLASISQRLRGLKEILIPDRSLSQNTQKETGLKETLKTQSTGQRKENKPQSGSTKNWWNLFTLNALKDGRLTISNQSKVQQSPGYTQQRTSSTSQNTTTKQRKINRFLVGLVIAAVLTGLSVVAISDYKSTFLINGAEYSTLSWLSPDKSEEAWTMETLKKIINNADSHADIMARSTAKDFGYVNGVDTKYWRDRLNRLRDSGIQPVLWLVSDDSPEVYRLGLQNQIDYQNQVVDAVDDLVSHYVVCLECDEFYSPQEVSVLIQNLRKKGVNKPIGVHLTPGVKPEYYKDADVIYLQTGFDLSEAQFRASIEEALRLGKPVVVSEYHMDGTTARARAFGDIACSYDGVVGTGNGRGTSVCKSLVSAEEKKQKKDYLEETTKLLKKNEAELAMFAILLIAWQDNFGRELPFMTTFNWATEDGYEVMFARELTQDTNVGVTISNRGRIMGFISGIFGGKNEKSSNHNKEAARR